MALNCKLAETILDVDELVWNEIVPRDHLICRHEYLHAVEASTINDCHYFYPVIYDGDRIVAHTCLYFISTELDLFAKGSVKRAIDFTRKCWKDFMILKSIECGTPVALGNTVSYRDGTDKKTVVMLIVREAERLARKLGAGVLLFRDFCEEELGLYDCLKNEGYTRIHNLPCARMDVRWSSFQDYLSSMRSEYRYKIKHRMAVFEQKGASIEVISDFSSCASQLAGLWKNAYDHATEYRREMLLKDFFENTSQHLADRSCVLLARVDDQPVGFSLLLNAGQTLIWPLCGLDYEYNAEYFIYFNMLYRIADMGISGGFKDIDLGITTLVPKMDIGAIVVPLYMYMKHLNTTLNIITPRLFERMTPKISLRSRNVFKQRN